MPQPTSPSPDAKATTAAGTAGPSRRSVVGGAAAAVWAAPAITVLASAPAFAASGQVQVTAFLPDATRPVSAYQRGTTQTFTATVTQGGSPVAAGTAVVFSLERLPGNTTATTDWLSLHPTNAATTTTTTTDASGQATITVRYLPGVVPTIPTTLRLTATTSTGSATLATWDLNYRPGRPGTPDPHGAFSVASSSTADHTLVLRNGTGYAFGSNNLGQLGIGSTASSQPSPTAISTTSTLNGKTITAIAAGGRHSLALASDGTLHAWGFNASGQLGNPNASLFERTAIAVTVAGTPLANKAITAIAAGDSHNLALASDGTLYAWGDNGNGRLGDGTGAARILPVQVTVPVGKTITAIAAGETHSLALASDGTVYAWGANTFGQLGNGTKGSATAIAVLGLAGTTITAIAAGRLHSLALASDGTVYAWGANASGQLGNGTNQNSNVAIAVTGLTGKTIASIAAGKEHSLALASDGTVYAWGANGSGQLGIGSNTSSTAAVALTKGTLATKTVVAIAAGNLHSVALTSDGTLHAWGDNASGQLGNGGTTGVTTAVQVKPLPA
ncbi:hypothetical protein K8Z61_10450 [Nocardioides sp. TRM66260-LWL]|uniref:RCC1 domain-containing protein n=1 Tax=Nocardioides sp. TRM66260-LWL TaxID=2874478 RepID=UPI001CC56ADE|nr:hypothetical protein [Nocardioides sp. TRM66260-LWL]MBZ5734916.1 hypothetical protein [Nocardioides sp. TRM66260-LWL]